MVKQFAKISVNRNTCTCHDLILGSSSVKFDMIWFIAGGMKSEEILIEAN